MSESRNKILANLHSARRPFTDISAPIDYLPVVPLDDHSPQALKVRFVAQAEKLACVVHQAKDETVAIQSICGLLQGAENISAWDFEQIPLPGLAEALAAAGVGIAAHDDPQVDFGITAAQAALAATGSLVVDSGPGKYRATSILPPTHIAIVKQSQIFASLESWIAHQREVGLDIFKRTSNIVLISGASRTADIGMQLVMGMHGPKSLHIVLLCDVA